MILAILVVGAAAFWDARQEAAESLRDFAHEQSSMAVAVGFGLTEHLSQTKDPSQEGLRTLSNVLRPIEEKNSSLLLIKSPWSKHFVTTDLHDVSLPELQTAAAQGRTWTKLSRDDAFRVGLPERSAIVGIANTRDWLGREWCVAAVSTALRERDRQIHAEWRLVLGFGLVSALVLGFGGVAQREQRRELMLAAEVRSAELRRESDERLVRADKLASLGALATGIAHEVSTPLGVIVGRAEQLMPRVANDERATRAVEAIATQAERIGQVIRSFLSLARGATPAFDRASAFALVDAAVRLVDHKFAQAGVTLSATTEGPPLFVACDPRLFEQVLVNLLLNACDACEPGGVVNISVQREADRVIFSVRDDGSGISTAMAERAIEPFVTTKAAGSGTGLGLAIANEIVKHHQGTLRLMPGENGCGTLALVSVSPAGESNV